MTKKSVETLMIALGAFVAGGVIGRFDSAISVLKNNENVKSVCINGRKKMTIKLDNESENTKTDNDQSEEA